MTFQDLENSKKKEELATKTINGSNIIKKGKEWYEKKLKMGWQETPDGILPMQEIQKAGFVYKDGVYKIPSEVYIAETSEFGHKKGQKYIGVSQQYLNWKKSRKCCKTVDDYVDEEIAQGFSVDDISFN